MLINSIPNLSKICFTSRAIRSNLVSLHYVHKKLLIYWLWLCSNLLKLHYKQLENLPVICHFFTIIYDNINSGRHPHYLDLSKELIVCSCMKRILSYKPECKGHFWKKGPRFFLICISRKILLYSIFRFCNYFNDLLHGMSINLCFFVTELSQY